MAMDLSKVLERLAPLKPALRDRFGVTAIHVFGFYARGEAGPDSDLDLLVDFAPSARPTLFSLTDLDQFLEDHLGVKAQAIPRQSLNPRLAPYINRDLVPA
jgi:predicted nucleotidyltransferase